MSSTPSTEAPTGRSAFFYGTLMAPQVLHRVCHGSTSPSNAVYTSSKLTTKPALLQSYRRHRVKGADYPGILPHCNSVVRGTYVTGLTDADIWRLDIFEGDEYIREKVKCRILGTPSSPPIATTATIGSDEIVETGEEVECETYVWAADPEDLEDAEWDFGQFQREKMRFWVGSEGEGEYAEVDEAVAKANGTDGTRGRGANGHITHALEEVARKSEV